MIYTYQFCLILTDKMLKRYKPNDSKPYCTKVGTAHALQWIFDNQLGKSSSYELILYLHVN